MNPSWKVVIFDFDDTLYLKTSYEFVSNVCDMLIKLHSVGLKVGLLTYNVKALSILKTVGLDRQFDFVIMIASKSERKSRVIQEHPIYRTMMQKRDVLFFDNDPFNVYDMESIGITSFLVNPITGISKDFIEKIVCQDFCSLKSQILCVLPRTYNYVERTTLSQNLQVLDRLRRHAYK